MREGDIFSWHWKEEFMPDHEPYHCKSRMAEFNGEHLLDSFWGSSPTDNSYLNADHVELKLLGNKNDLEVFKDKEEYYNAEDLLIMRHPNNGGAKTLVKPGAKRSADVMRAYLRGKQERLRRQIESSTRDLERLAVIEHSISQGEIEKLYF